MSDYFDTGFCVRSASWHGKERLVDDYPESWEQAREWAGLTWEPIKVPAFGFTGITGDGQVTYVPGEGVTGDYFEMPEHERVIRSDTGSTLAVAKDSYTLITHKEMGEVVDELLAAPNVKYDTAGSVRDGRQVWALCYLDEPVTLPGDISLTLPYFALTNAHDGSAALRAQYTSVRIVCANTYSAAEAEADRHGHAFTFRHTKNWREKVEDAKKALQGVRDDFASYCETMTDLLGIPVTPRQRELFVREFVPMPVDGIISDRVVRNIEEARQAIRDILASPTTAEVAHTAAGLVYAAGEYLDHVRGYRNRDTLLGRQILRAEPLKARASTLARQVATANV